MKAPTLPCRPRSERTDGFSLVELLVAIAVIGILAGILFPVVSGARSRAHAAECTANLRAIWGGLTLYAQDHGNKLPQTNSVNQQNYQWRPDADNLPESAQKALLSYLLQDYGVNPEAFECPVGLDEVGRPAGGAHYRRVHWVLDRSGSRHYPFVEPMSLPRLHAVPESGPSDVILIYDAVIPGNENFMQEPPHGGKRNFLFLDGSVRPLSSEEEPTFG